MPIRDLVKAFIAGLAFPAVFFPIMYTVVYFKQMVNLQLYPLQFMALYLPIIFGLSNIVYLAFSREVSSVNKNTLMWVIGLLLGLAVAVMGVFYLHLPKMIFNMSGNYQYSPLVVLPITYGIVFRYIIKWLNSVVNV
jgi:hypothetical protein